MGGWRTGGQPPDGMEELLMRIREGEPQETEEETEPMKEQETKREKQYRVAYERSQHKLHEVSEMADKYKGALDRLNYPPFHEGAVLSVRPDGLTIAAGGSFLEVLKPPDMELVPGDRVLIASGSMQVVSKVHSEPTGKTATFVKDLGDGKAEIEYGASPKIVFMGSGKPEKGDRVIMDNLISVIIDNMGKPATKYTFDTGSSGDSVGWDDIGGLEEAKEQLIQAIELPYKFPAIFKHYNQKPPKGILLHGVPGCGKTLLGKAVATSIAKIFKSPGGFIYVKAPELLNRYVGATEETIRLLFQQAQQFKKDKGFPAVLFIDEADAILAKRGSRRSSDMDKTIVPMFLSEMDGLEDSGALVILVTNRPDTLDAAVVREGRIDIKIRVGRPTAKVAYSIFGIYLKKKPLGKGLTCDKMSAQGRDELFSPKHVIYSIKTKEEVKRLTMGDIVTGSMIASIVERAASMALMRDLKGRTTTGVLEEDLSSAIYAQVKQTKEVEHKEALDMFIKDNRIKVEAVRREE